MPVAHSACFCTKWASLTVQDTLAHNNFNTHTQWCSYTHTSQVFALALRPGLQFQAVPFFRMSAYDKTIPITYTLHVHTQTYVTTNSLAPGTQSFMSSIWRWCPAGMFLIQSSLSTAYLNNDQSHTYTPAAHTSAIWCNICELRVMLDQQLKALITGVRVPFPVVEDPGTAEHVLCP